MILLKTYVGKAWWRVECANLVMARRWWSERLPIFGIMELAAEPPAVPAPWQFAPGYLLVTDACLARHAPCLRIVRHGVGSLPVVEDSLFDKVETGRYEPGEILPPMPDGTTTGPEAPVVVPWFRRGPFNGPVKQAPSVIHMEWRTAEPDWARTADPLPPLVPRTWLPPPGPEMRTGTVLDVLRRHALAQGNRGHREFWGDGTASAFRSTPGKVGVMALWETGPVVLDR